MDGQTFKVQRLLSSHHASLGRWRQLRCAHYPFVFTCQSRQQLRLVNGEQDRRQDGRGGRRVTLIGGVKAIVGEVALGMITELLAQ